MTEAELDAQLQLCMTDLLDVLERHEVNGCLYVSTQHETDSGTTLIGISRLRLTPMTGSVQAAVAEQVTRQMANLTEQLSGTTLH